jgi:hypothetical protein
VGKQVILKDFLKLASHWEPFQAVGDLKLLLRLTLFKSLSLTAELIPMRLKWEEGRGTQHLVEFTIHKATC